MRATLTAIFLFLGLVLFPGVRCAAAGPPALSAPEAATLIEIMNDPQKRAALAIAVQALAAPPPAAAKQSGSSAKPSTPAAAIAAAIAASANNAGAPVVKLAPDSVGAQVLNQTSAIWSNLNVNFTNAQHHLAGFGAAYGFFTQKLSDPNSRTALLRYLSSSFAALMAAVGIDLVFSWLLRGPRRALCDLAPKRRSEKLKLRVRARHGAGLILVSAADFLVACLVIIASVTSGLVCIQLLHAGFGDTPVGSAELLIFCYAAGRLGGAAAGILVAPQAPKLRLLACSDRTARYIVRATLCVLLIGGLGYSAVEILTTAGLPELAETALVKTVLFGVAVALIVIVLQCRVAVSHRLREGANPQTLGGKTRLIAAGVWHKIAIFLIAGAWIASALTLRHSLWHLVILSILSFVAVWLGRAFSQSSQRALERGLSGSSAWAGYDFDIEARLRRWQGFLRVLLQVTAYAIAAVMIAAIWGYDVRTAFRSQALGGRLLSANVTILLTALGAIVIYEFINAMAERKITRHMREAQFAAAARLRTLLPILHTVLTLVLGSVFVLTMLNEIGINTAPILAGAGIIGVAIGFGSQKLVQDFITGIFLLFENAMQVGDYVTVAGLAGTVEALSIRTMRLRATDGSVHLVPFSSVTTVTNVHRGIGNAAISITVPADSDIDTIFAILHDIASGMRADAQYEDMIRADLTLYGVDKIEAGIITITGQISCSDTGRLPVQREFNRRLAQRMAQAGIRISAPIQSVYNISTGPDQPEPVKRDET